MPVIYTQKYSNGLTIGIWELSEPSSELLDQITLSADELQKLNSFKLETRKKEWLATRLLIQHFLGANHSIEYTSTGKPNLKSNVAQIGISHTAGFACIIIHPSKTVAIDIERPSARVLRVSDRFLNDDERKINHPFSEELFQTIIWSAKEAMFKWCIETDIVFKDHLLIKTAKFPDCSEFQIDSEIEKNDQCNDLPLYCCITDQYVLVYTL